MIPRVRFCRTADGVRVAFGTNGAGPPLVAAPTWLTNLEFDWEMPVWAHWFKTLCHDYTLIRYDLRGCGLSDRDIHEFSLDGWVSDLEAVVDALELETFPLMGLCQGGVIAAAYAAKHPERVSRLILYGSYVQGGLVRHGHPSTAEEIRALAVLIGNGWGRPVPAFRELFARLLLPSGSPETIRALSQLEKRSTTPETARRMWLAFHALDIEELASSVRMPTLVLHCRADAMVPFAEGRRLAALIPNAEFVGLEGNNHIIQEDEACWIELWREIRSFLRNGTSVDPAVAGRFGLTPRERELLHLVAQGRNNAEIADCLGISQKTVRNHVSSIFEKLSVSHRAQAVVRAREAGFGGETGLRSYAVPGAFRDKDGNFGTPAS